jgi:hypothetical protein
MSVGASDHSDGGGWFPHWRVTIGWFHVTAALCGLSCPSRLLLSAVQSDGGLGWSLTDLLLAACAIWVVRLLACYPLFCTMS